MPLLHFNFAPRVLLAPLQQAARSDQQERRPQLEPLRGLPGGASAADVRRWLENDCKVLRFYAAYDTSTHASGQASLRTVVARGCAGGWLVRVLLPDCRHKCRQLQIPFLHPPWNSEYRLTQHNTLDTHTHNHWTRRHPPRRWPQRPPARRAAAARSRA